MTIAVETDRATLVARSVSRSFGAVRALDEVDIVVRPGRVHALVGENGAGKSTLAKILAGVDRPDAGTLELAGAAYAPRNRAEGRALGVDLVPQQLSLVGELNLVDNFLLAGRRRLLRRGAARDRLEGALTRAGVSVDLDIPTSALTQAHRQLGEIVLALADGATTLILDEPTASLGPVEVGGLFEHLRALCDLGAAVVLITHRLKEVRAVADDVTVLSHGRLVHAGDARGLHPAEIARLMVGELPEPAPRAERVPGDVVVDVRGVAAGSDRGVIRDIDLTVRGGEIVGVAGVAGSGQGLLLDVLAGLASPTEGSLTVAGCAAPDAAALTAAGVAWIPEERSEALVPAMSLGDTLAVYDSARGARRRRADRPAGHGGPADLLAGFDVRPPVPSLAAGGLSGGNQQKLLVARELGRRWPGRPHGAPAVVLAYGPTQGLDLRASQAIRERLVSAAEAGAAVIVASHDLEELLSLADRIVVLFSGRIVADLAAADATTDRVGAAMAGLTASVVREATP